jgi:tRNA threonylcarbamoyl adenosine modification protein (Sua5/YciO/YrdC/YwlC family)
MQVEIHPEHPEPRKIRRALDALESGEVIAYPTDTVYALGCDLHNKRAIDRLYKVKGMDRSQHLAFVCQDLSGVSRYAVVDDASYRLLKRFLPGPYVFILEATREVPKIVQMPKKTVGIRVPAHPVALALAAGLGRPLISTTAARHGEDPSPDPGDIAVAFPDVALVDLTGEAPVVVRAGAGDVAPFARGRQ